MKAGPFAYFGPLAMALVAAGIPFFAGCGRTALDNFSDGAPPRDSGTDSLDGDTDADGGACVSDAALTLPMPHLARAISTFLNEPWVT